MEKSDKQEGREYPNVKVLLTPLNFSEGYVECEVRLVAEPSGEGRQEAKHHGEKH